MKLDKVVEGKHNKEGFRFEKGFLLMFGRRWDKDDIQTLVEVANLLQLEGYKIKRPIGTEKTELEGMFGRYVADEKIYEDGE